MVVQMKKPRRHQGAAPKVRAIEVIVADCKAEIDAAKVQTVHHFHNHK